MEELNNVVVDEVKEVVADEAVKTGNPVVKVVIGVGAAVVAGLATVFGIKHIKNKNAGETGEAPRKRLFGKKKEQQEEVQEVVEATEE